MSEVPLPSISLVIAAWNAADTINRAIDSALGQAEVDFEILVVDDASTDRTAAVVQAYADPRIVYVPMPTNSGPAAARNRGFAAASKALVAVLDADDAILPGRLARLAALARDTGADIVADNLILHRDDTGAEEPFFPVSGASPENVTLAEYLLDNLVFDKQRTLGYLKPAFRTAFVREKHLRYDESLRVGEDFLFVADALALGASFAWTRKPGYVYTVGRAGTISNRLTIPNLTAMIAADGKFLSRHADKLRSGDLRAAKTRSHSLADAMAFLTTVDQLKSRRLPQALLTMTRRPASIRHFRMPLRLKIRALRQRTAR